MLRSSLCWREGWQLSPGNQVRVSFAVTNHLPKPGGRTGMAEGKGSTLNKVSELHALFLKFIF